MTLPVILVDIFKDVCSKVTVNGITNVNFDAGRNLQIVQGLIKMDNSVSLKDKKYPLIAMQLPNIEDMGQAYVNVTVRRIIIATLTNPTTPVLDRYSENGTFKTILYPVYYELLNQLARSTAISGNDPEAFIHQKIDNPSVNETAAKELTDYVDAIEIVNLKLNLIKAKICK